jgi:hypothetical protein
LKPVEAGRRDGDDVAPQHSIPGFVAVAAARSVAVPKEEVERFADAYEAICGDRGRRRSCAALHARVVEFTHEDAGVVDAEVDRKGAL